MRSSLTLPPDQFQLLLREMLASDAAGGLVARAAARRLQKFLFDANPLHFRTGR